jgi:hypothetical protein
MAEVAEQTKVALAAFSCFTWQCDVVQEITAREAEAFFKMLETPHAAAEVETMRSELHAHYTKNWRDYLKHGPVPATELSLLSHQLGASRIQWVTSMLDATFAAAPSGKRKSIERIHGSLKRLIQGEDAVLPDLQGVYRSSRFFETQPESVRQPHQPLLMRIARKPSTHRKPTSKPNQRCRHRLKRWLSAHRFRQPHRRQRTIFLC